MNSIQSIETHLPEVLPAIEGDNTEAQQILLAHCTRTPKNEKRHKNKPDPDECLNFFKASSACIKTAPSACEALAKFRAILLGMCEPWLVTNAMEPWGWHALRIAIEDHDSKTVLALLENVDCPNAYDLTTHIISGNPGKTAMGWLLETMGKPGHEQHERLVLEALIQHGVKLDATTGTNSLNLPLQQAVVSSLHLPISHGARIDVDTHGNPWILHVVSSQLDIGALARILARVTKAAQVSDSIGEQLKPLWPQFLQLLAKRIARMASAEAEDTFLVLHQLAQATDLPLTSRVPGEVTFFGALTHELVMGGLDPWRVINFPTFTAIIKGISISRCWTGQIKPGTPDGVWGLLAMVQHKATGLNNPGIPKGSVADFIAGDHVVFWNGFCKQAKELASHPATWKSLIALRSSMPRKVLVDLRNHVFQHLIDNFSTGNNGVLEKLRKGSGAAYLRLAAEQIMDEQWYHRKNIRPAQFEPRLLTLAIQMSLITGWTPKMAKLGLPLLRKCGDILDMPAIVATMTKAIERGAISRDDQEDVVELTQAVMQHMTSAALPARPRARI